MQLPVYIVYARPFPNKPQGDAPLAVCATAKDAECAKAAFDARSENGWPEHYIKAFVSKQTLSDKHLVVIADLTDELICNTRGAWRYKKLRMPEAP